MKASSASPAGSFVARHFNLISFAVLAVMILIAYSNTFTASFHFDDDAAIAENPAIKRVSVDNIIALSRTNRPITNLSLMFNYALGGMNVVGWHIFNISFHIANSFLVYVFLLWTFKLPVFQYKYSAKAERMALFAALLFAVHPIQTESVTYIISRSELLAAFFFLCSFLLFISGVRRNKVSYYVLALFTSLLAIASKEWAATLPLVILIYDYLFIADGSFKSLRSRWKAYVILFLPWVLAAYILSLYQGASSAGFSITGQKGITPWTYLLTSFNVIWTYIRLLILPVNQNLDYDYPLAKTLFEMPTILSFLAHILVVFGAIWLYRKRKSLVVPFGAAWFYIILAPTQSFVPILDLIFEHRVYLPSVGFFMIVVVLYEGLFEWLGRKKTEAALPQKA